MSLSLNKKLCYIGLRIDFKEKKKRKKRSFQGISIEEVLVEAAREIPNDSKMMSLIASWIRVHGNYLFFTKLKKEISKIDSDSIDYEWAKVVYVIAKEASIHKIAFGAEKKRKKLYPLSKDLIDSAIKLKGVEKLYKEYGYIIPNGFLRIRSDDVLSPKELAQQNTQYKNRLLYGSGWRADIITAIQGGADNPFAISKSIGCSYEPAHRIFNEYKIASGH